MKKVLLIISFLWHIVFADAQALQKNKIISGPVLGQVELRTASIWIEVTPDIKKIAVKYWKKNDSKTAHIKNYTGELGNEFNPVKIEIGGLDINTTYQYDFLLNGQPA